MLDLDKRKNQHQSAFVKPQLYVWIVNELQYVLQVQTQGA